MQNYPKHIAIIMDGNRRWAKNNGFARSLGYRKGAESGSAIIKRAMEIGIPYLTLFAFSAENWNRSSEEIDDLMSLLAYYIDNKLDVLSDNGVKLNFIGEIEGLPPKIYERIQVASDKTKNNKRLVLTVALNYGAKQEIISAVKQIVDDIQNKVIFKDDINLESFAQRLYTSNLPDPDLLIRTSGEQRISNFLLWQIAYAELYFTNVSWPDFTSNELDKAIDEFMNRKRNYGS